MDSRSAHLVNPPVEARGLLQREVPPNKLEGTIAWYLLPSGDETGDVSGIDEVALLVGSGVHGDKRIKRWTLGANPYLPTGYMVSTWWVLKQNTQHGPTGSMLITF